MPRQPLIKVLTGSGIGSRRQMTAVIKRGGVTINGRVAESYNEPVDPTEDTVSIDGRTVSTRPEPNLYLMLNKPGGIVSTTRGERGEKTVIDILPQEYRQVRVYPVGRLDKDSTGLVLLTNDGNLAYKLTHPRFEQEKEYLVRTDGILTPEEMTKLEKGIDLEDGKTSPAKVETSKQVPFNYSVTIHEGRKRQIRRMFAALGYKVLELRRVRFANLRLGTLPQGKVRNLTASELESLRRG